MKTTKMCLLIILFVVSMNVFAQDVQHFLGTYYIEELCKDEISGEEYFAEYKIVLLEGINSDMILNMNGHDIQPGIEVFVVNDSLFIPLRWVELLYANDSATFQGRGRIVSDSIFLNYLVGGSMGFFNCDCKGEKNSVNIIYHSLFGKNKIHYDAKKGVIIIDNSLQNQSFLFEVFDLQGKIILKKINLNSETINIAHIQDGIYIFRLLKNGKIMQTGKIIKCR